MKKLVVGTVVLAALIAARPACAADQKAAPILKAPPPPIVYNWTGCYIGAAAGLDSGRTRHSITTGPRLGDTRPDFQLNGAIAGGTLGCNYQTSNIIFGIEGDFSWTNKEGDAFALPPFNVTRSDETSEKWLGTFRGRLGYTPWERAFLYATGGGAVANIEAKVCAFNGTCVSETKSVLGWAVGVGVEFALWDAWTAKAEYLHVEFGPTSFLSHQTIGTQTFEARNVPVLDDVFRVGVNYRLGWVGGPVMPRY
jgi:outer membrane immunogenic protein